MQLKTLVPVALAGLVSAQQQTPGLAALLASQNSSLSALNGLLAANPTIVQALSSAQNITLFAPSNDAIAAFLNSSAAAAAGSDPNLIGALLSYHVLNGTNYASSFTNSSRFIRTLLTDTRYANVTGGQRVEVSARNGSVVIYSGLGEASVVQNPNLNFTGGTVHIVNRVLTIPPTINATLRAANLTALTGAIQAANLGTALAGLRNVTVFAPSNEAFNAIGSLGPNLTAQVLAPLLQYHVLPNTLGYSSGLMNGSFATLGGQNITISIINGSVFANSAKVITPNVLVGNGVVHIIDNVLNPANSTVAPNPTGSNPPVFGGATTGTGGVPFTSGIPTPTNTAPVATNRPGATSTTPNAAVPARTGAVGAAMLFGAGAVLVNM